MVENVLVIGATGHLGQYLVPALLERGKKVHLLFRKTTLAEKAGLIDQFRHRGAIIHEGDLHDEESLTRAMIGIEAVVSAVGGEQVLDQARLLEPMKKAGIKHFIPSEYGIPVESVKEGRSGLIDMRRSFQQQIKESGISYTIIAANAFASYWAVGLGQLGPSAPSMSSVNVFGTGDIKAHIITPQDVARVTALAIDDDRTENKTVGIFPSSNSFTQSELITLWEEISGKTVKRVTVTCDEVDRRIEELSKDPAHMMEIVVAQLEAVVWIDGAAATCPEFVLNTLELYPDLVFTSVKTVLVGLVASPIESEL